MTVLTLCVPHCLCTLLYGYRVVTYTALKKQTLTLHLKKFKKKSIFSNILKMAIDEKALEDLKKQNLRLQKFWILNEQAHK